MNQKRSSLADLLDLKLVIDVVDIGANPIDGVAPYKSLLDGGHARVVGFEPNPDALARLIALVKGGTVSHQAAKRVFAEVAARGGDPRTVAESLGVIQVADTGVLAGWVDEVLGAHAPEVGRYKGGETKLMAFFLGQVMKASRGKADPKLTQRLIEERLAS